MEIVSEFSSFTALCTKRTSWEAFDVSCQVVLCTFVFISSFYFISETPCGFQFSDGLLWMILSVKLRQLMTFPSSPSAPKKSIWLFPFYKKTILLPLSSSQFLSSILSYFIPNFVFLSPIGEMPCHCRVIAGKMCKNDVYLMIIRYIALYTTPRIYFMNGVFILSLGAFYFTSVYRWLTVFRY